MRRKRADWTGVSVFVAISLAVHLACLGAVLMVPAHADVVAPEPLPLELVAQPLAPTAPMIRPTVGPRRASRPPRKPVSPTRTTSPVTPLRRATSATSSPETASSGSLDLAPSLPVAANGDAAPASTEGGTGAARKTPSGGPTVPPVEKPSPVVPPRALDAARPIYPSTARRRRAEGLTLIRVRVSRRGEVLDAQLASSSGAADLDRSALEAARRWRFRPGLRGDEPIEAWVKVPVRFDLAGSL